MFTPGRTLVAAAAAIGLCGSLAGVVMMHPMGLLAQAAARPSMPAVTQPDFFPMDDAKADPRPTPSRPAVNVYRATQAGTLSPAVAGIPARVYVPNSASGTLDVIDPATYKIIAHYWVGAIPHHVAPAWDLKQLYVDAEGSGMLSVIDPRTGSLAGRVTVPDPYNLYFTPDGTKAVVVAEVLRRLDFRDPHTFQLIRSVPIPWRGVDHLDFSADGSYLMASTEFAGVVVKVDTIAMQITGFVQVGGLPVDVRLSPDGSVFYVANQGRGGVSVVDPVAMKEVGFIKTGRGAHGLMVSRDTKFLYVTNRLAGTISVIDFDSRSVVATWRIGGSPDMVQLTPDGSQLWTTGRYDGVVYVVDTTSGKLLHTIRVGGQPHGLTYFPNAGRYSLGHNGVYR
jgi:YVTN family beta-propeller protein